MNRKICLKGVSLVERCGDEIKINVCDLFIRGGVIVGRDLDLSGYEALDFTEKVLMQRFINLHSHLGECVFSNIEGGGWTIAKYLEYTNSELAKNTKQQNAEDWKRSADCAILQMCQSGTIGYCAGRAYEVEDNLPIVLGGYPFMLTKKLQDYSLDAFNKFIQTFKEKRKETLKIGVFFHSLYANNEENLILAKKCMDYGADFFTIHLSEDVETRAKELERFGKLPIKVLDEYGLLTPKTILVHCGCLVEEELELVALRGATIAVCPKSNKFLNTRVIDIEKLMQLGINWCLCSDGLATGRTFSLMEQGVALRQISEGVSYCDIYDAITSSPAIFISSKKYSGKFSEGSLAKFILASADNKPVLVEEFLQKVFSGEKNIQLLDF